MRGFDTKSLLSDDIFLSFVQEELINVIKHTLLNYNFWLCLNIFLLVQISAEYSIRGDIPVGPI